MGYRPPFTTFSDQDRAMSNAIKSVLPTTRHRPCQWHIEKNAPSNIGAINAISDFRFFFFSESKN